MQNKNGKKTVFCYVLQCGGALNALLLLLVGYGSIGRGKDIAVLHISLLESIFFIARPWL